MSKIDLVESVKSLPEAWCSKVLGCVGGANFKVLRMDASAYPDECHDFDEALLVLEGQMNLEIQNSVVTVRAGEVFIVPAGIPHAVAPGSFGLLSSSTNDAEPVGRADSQRLVTSGPISFWALRAQPPLAAQLGRWASRK